MDMPASVALGLAFKPMPGLLVEADVKRIFFSDVMDRSLPDRRPDASQHELRLEMTRPSMPSA